MTRKNKKLTKENSSKKAREEKQLVALENKLDRSMVLYKPKKAVQPSLNKSGKVQMTELHRALGHHYFPGEYGPQKCPSGSYSGYTVGASDRTVVTPYIYASTSAAQAPNCALVVSSSNPGLSFNCWYPPYAVNPGSAIQFSEPFGGTDTWFTAAPQSVFPAKANFRGAKLNSISMTVSTVYAAASSVGTLIVGLMPDFAAVDNGTGFNNNVFSMAQLSTMPHAQVIPVSSLATKGPITLVSHKLGPRADEFLDCSNPFTGNIGTPLPKFYDHPGVYVNSTTKGKTCMLVKKEVSSDFKPIQELTPQQYHFIKYDKEIGAPNTTIYQAYGDDMMVPFVAVQTIGGVAIQFDVTISRSWEGVIDPATMQQAAGAYGFPVGTISGSKERTMSVHKRVNEIAQKVPIIPAPSIGTGIEQTVDTLIRVADKVGKFATSPQTQQTLETIATMFGGVGMAMGAI